MIKRRIYFAYLRKRKIVFGEPTIVEVILLKPQSKQPENIWKFFGKICTTKKMIREKADVMLKAIEATTDHKFDKLEVI